MQRFVVLTLGLLACAAAFAFALFMLAGVLRGVAADAQLLGFWPWLAAVAGIALVVSAIGWFAD